MVTPCGFESHLSHQKIRYPIWVTDFFLVQDGTRTISCNSSPRDNFDFVETQKALCICRVLFYLLENVDINPLRDFRYTLLRSICADALDMLLHTSPTAIYVKSERDLYHIETDRKGGYIEFERSENISSETK